MILRLAKYTAVAAAGMLMLPLAFGSDEASKAPPPANGADVRANQVRDFFRIKRSPLAAHAPAFLEAADQHGLDWRLLPCLALVETGGAAIRNNNVFGWGNGRIRFASVSDSIQMVAERLANGAPYRKKTTEGKLKAYNPRNRKYAAHVLAMMALVGPDLAPLVAQGEAAAAIVAERAN